MGYRNIARLWMESLKRSEALPLISGDVLTLRPITDDTGYLAIGDGTTDCDVKVYLGATTKYVLLDMGNAQLQLEDVDQLLGDNDVLKFGDGTGGDVAVSWNATYLQGAAAPPLGGPWKNAPSMLDPEYRTLVHELFDDFDLGTAALGGGWLSKDDGGTGTNAYQDLAGGVYGVLTAAADNDYHAMYSVTANFTPIAAKPLWFEARFKLTEATVNESAWWFGISDTVATTGGFQANAVGPLGTYDGVLVWKDEATMTIDFETSNGATQNTTSNMGTFVTNTWTKVGFYVDGTATTSVVYPFIDVGSGWVAGTQQNLTLASFNPAAVVFGVKAGPSAAAETLMVDYVRCVQLR